MTADPAGPRSAPRAWLSLVLLAAIMAAGNVMLGTFSALQEPAKAELGFSDIQMSLLNGLAVSIPLALFSIPAGLLVDRAVRVRLLLWTSLAWTAGTILTALAHAMPLLFFARMLTGLGANISTTIAISLAADLSAPERRGRSLLLLTIGKYAGSGLAFALGGGLLGYFVQRGGLAGMAPWRSVHLALGVASLALSAGVLLLAEPARRELNADRHQPFLQTFRALLAYRRFLLPLFLGQTSVLMADAAAAIWAAPVLSRSFDQSPEQFAGWMGGVIFAAGILGALAGGFAADLGHRSGRRGGVLLGAVVASVIAVPAALFPVAPSLPIFAATLLLFLLGGTVTGLVTATALAVLMPNELRGISVGTFIAVGGLIAFGAAPTLVAWVSGQLGGEAHLAPALAMVGLAVSVLGAAGFALAARRAPQPII